MIQCFQDFEICYYYYETKQCDYFGGFMKIFEFYNDLIHKLLITKKNWVTCSAWYATPYHLNGHDSTRDQMQDIQVSWRTLDLQTTEPVSICLHISLQSGYYISPIVFQCTWWVTVSHDIVEFCLSLFRTIIPGEISLN